MGTFFNYEKLRKGLTGAVTVAAGAVSKGLEVAKDLAEDLTSFKALKDYKLAGHVATAGPGGCWRIFSAINKKPGAVFPEAAVWILDKKALTDQASRAGRARGFDTFFEQQRRGCTQLLRVKHPGVIKVIEPLEETGGQMVMVTEPVFGSLANLLSQFREVPTAPQDRASATLTPLEAKYGLNTLAETLHFLHHEAHLVHCNINPGSIVVARDGGWKLAGFEFVGSSADGFAGSSTPQLAFEYSSAHPSPWEEYSQPPLGFTPPELVGGCMSSSEVVLSGAADCFSLAALTYLLTAGKELLPVGSSTGEYRSRLRMLTGSELQGLPHTLQSMLAQMLSSTPSARPNAAAFSGCQWFQEDMLLRCLKFLDTILQRDTGQKVSFLKDLSGLYQQFDDRLLQHRVLPPVVAEMRNEVVALAALPLVLAIMGRMKPEGFAASGILPVLKPVFEQADGEVLLALVKHLAVFYNLMPSDAVVSVLVPLMLRAFDSPNTRCQEELLKGLHRLAPDMPYNLLKDGLMPRVVGLCLRTTSLVVRVSALSLMAEAVHRLDKEAAGSMLDMCGQIVAVDRSAGTAMAVLKLGEAIGKHYGPELTALRVLPLLCPLLLCPGLNTAQFSGYLSTIRGLLDRVAEKRAGELSAAGAAGSVAAAARANSSGLLGATGTPTAGISSSNNRGSAGDLSDSSSLFGGGGGGSGGTAAAGLASWDVPVSSPSSSRAAANAAAATTGQGWSSTTTASTSSSWQQPQPQQQQQQQWSLPSPSAPAAAAARGSSRPSGMAAPDIFSSATSNGNSYGVGGGGGDLLAGLNLGSIGGAAGPGNSSIGSSSNTASWSLGASTTAAAVGGSANSHRGVGRAGSDDLFGGLAVAGQGSSAGGSIHQQQQQQQQQHSMMALKPPPSASKPINLLSTGSGGVMMGGGTSSSSQDPFASLAGPTSNGNSAAAFDPFSTLAAAPTAAAGGGGGGAMLGGGVDAFAGLTSGLGGSNNRPMNAQRPQQQQQWQGSGGGGSLI